MAKVGLEGAEITAVNEENHVEVKIERQFRPFAEKMEENGLLPVVIDTFRHYYALLVHGETGLISKADIDPVRKDEIADAERLTGLEEAGRTALQKLVVIKLNGGLGTSMGLSRAKSLLEVKQGLSFLDIIARQILTHREKRGVNFPVVFMNSFNTEADTLEALASYKDLAPGLPLTFVQHKFPKVFQEGLIPATWPSNPDMEWNPPGHGDIYAALVTSGMLEQLLGAGIRYAFVSNSDNLGAVVDETILGYFARNNFPFMMEVTDRTEADSKGGHLARLKNGRLTLREIAQCPEDEIDAFQDIRLYKYFNTNTIWISLVALKALLEACNNVIHLPMIRNPKTVDPRDDSTPGVYQIEMAMGSAVSVFEAASAIRVPRARFTPVKKCPDLLALWSDAYILTQDYFVAQNPLRKMGTLVLKLDSKYYKKINQLKARFPHGAPSLVGCKSLEIEGDILFGRNVVIRNEVVISNHARSQATISDGSVIEKDLIFG
jgi:UTP--glucose-1-phosphate uridylyltransferase